MPNPQGRTGGPGDNTAYKPIGIACANPSKMSAKRMRSNMSVSEVFSKKSDGKRSGKSKKEY